jgi:hypothetical protein
MPFHPFIAEGDTFGFYSAADLEPSPPFLRTCMKEQYDAAEVGWKIDMPIDVIYGLNVTEAAQVAHIFIRFIQEVIGFHAGNLDLTGRHEQVAYYLSNYSSSSDGISEIPSPHDSLV